MKPWVTGFIIQLVFAMGCCRNDPLNGDTSPDQSKQATSYFNNGSGKSSVTIEKAPGHSEIKKATVLEIDGLHPLSVKW